MSENQKQWAAMHDWFICSTQNGIIAQDVEIMANGELVCKNKLFTCFNTLRDWAGY